MRDATPGAPVTTHERLAWEDTARNFVTAVDADEKDVERPDQVVHRQRYHHRYIQGACGRAPAKEEGERLSNKK